jgi:L-asparaginase / beta-aspartyl-peptidase
MASRHVLLVAEGAHRFAREHGIPAIDPATLVTDKAKEKLRKKLSSPGTVGAVARDRAGRVAAATSTGGTTGKLPGRVGDTPLIGAGTYADDAAGACSCTGLGEAIIKVTLARMAVARLKAGQDPMEAARQAVAELSKAHGDGGLILVDRQGRMGFAFDTARMSRAWVTPDGIEGAGFD